MIYSYQSTIKCDEPTPKAQRIFPRKLLEEAVERFNQRIVDQGGVMGMLEAAEDEQVVTIDLVKVSHMIERAFIDDDDHLSVEVRFIDTDHGKLARLTPDVLEVAPILTGFTDWHGETNVVTEAELHTFNLRAKD